MIEPEVKKLLALKEEYKTAAGQEWKPISAPTSSTVPATVPSKTAEELHLLIKAQGDAVRKLKTEKAAKVKFYTSIRECLITL